MSSTRYPEGTGRRTGTTLMQSASIRKIRLAAQAWLLSHRWLALLLLSCLLTAVLETLQLPAALLLGPMIAAILVASGGGTVHIARPLFFAAQAIVGIMIASHLPPSVFDELAADWPIFLAGTLSTLCASSLLGWTLARSGTLPGTTAIWGSAPGAAMAMTLMSEAYGADMRLVAFMLYLRVVACAVAATLVARCIGASVPGHALEWMPAASIWQQAPYALAIAGMGVCLGIGLRVPGGALLVPMAMGMVARSVWSAPLVVPMPVLAIGYALIGWTIGMRFSPDVLRHVARVFPRVLLAILTLIAICAGFGGLLAVLVGIDPLTAYLATSPGGADSVAIIAASTKVDLPFIMAMQVARFLLVLVAGPTLARLLSRGSCTRHG